LTFLFIEFNNLIWIYIVKQLYIQQKMNDPERLIDNYVGRRGKSSAGGMPSWALLSKWEQTGIAEDVNQVNKFQRNIAKDFTPDKPWLESDQQFNGDGTTVAFTLSAAATTNSARTRIFELRVCRNAAVT
jgi:hypothetical protein